MISNSKFQIQNFSRGITLVEILVVIFLVSLFSGILITNFPRIQLQFSLDGAVHKFAQDLKNAQELGGSGAQLTLDNGTVVPVSGYGVYLSPAGLGEKQYIIYADKNANQTYDIGEMVKKIDFTSDYPKVIIKEIYNANKLKLSINFKPPNTVVSISDLLPDADSVDIVFGIEGDSSINDRTVSINKLGLIEIK